MANLEEIFTNIKLSLGEVFGDIESYNVEHIGRDITIVVPSKYLQEYNWNSKGLNKTVNVKLTFENAHPIHTEDKKVGVRLYLKNFFNSDKWYGIDVSHIKESVKHDIFKRMHEEMEKYFSSILNNVIIKGEEDFRFSYKVTLILDNYDNYDYALANAELLKKVITELEQKLAEIVEIAIDELKQYISAEEDEYQRIKAQRNATLTTIVTENKLSSSEVISKIRAKELSQEQLKEILNVIE